jgi:hypothetical protein
MSLRFCSIALACTLAIPIAPNAEAEEGSTVNAQPINYSSPALPKRSILDQLRGYRVAQSLGACNRESCDTCSRPLYRPGGYVCIRCHSCAGDTGQYNCMYTQNC